ncbi:MAG: glycoside hydrolase family 88 protein [Eubacteriales bacterium]|nr:glycoside hydrolase family 88 protein [Eubacteriales bacterium]
MDIQAYVQRYLRDYQPYKAYWNYEDGCVLTGCIRLYRASGEEAYRAFALDYLSRAIESDGSIPSYPTNGYNIDSINAGKALFFAWEETGDSRYQKAIEFHMERLLAHPRCQNGGFWHKSIYPNQVWLDGLYMALPFYMEYEKRLDGMKRLKDITGQLSQVEKHLYDPKKGLFYHAWDEKKAQPWANPVTGCSPNFWLRSTGWLLMALVDCLEQMSEELFDEYHQVESLFKKAVRGLLPYRDEKTGLFLQVIDHPEAEHNYAETSGSAMAAYAIMKGARLNALNPDKYLPIGREIFEKLVEQKLQKGEDGEAHLVDICKVAGLGPGEKRDGSVAYYLSEPKTADDSKGVGPFMMAWAEYRTEG